MKNREYLELTEEHIAACATIMAETPLWQRYGVTYASATQLLRQGSQEDEQHLWIARIDEQPVGFIWYSVRGTFYQGGYVRFIGVHPAYTGQRIGEGLLTLAEDTVMQHNHAHIFLLVSDFNQAAQRFYHRRGYQQVGSLPGYVLPEVAELIFWKRLLPKITST